MESISIFFKDDAGDVFHTYSAYARGIDLLGGAMTCLDLVPKGRDENGRRPGLGFAGTTNPTDQPLARRHRLLAAIVVEAALVLRPSQPASTYFTSSGQGRYFESARPS